MLQSSGMSKLLPSHKSPPNAAQRHKDDIGDIHRQSPLWEALCGQFEPRLRRARSHCRTGFRAAGYRVCR